MALAGPGTQDPRVPAPFLPLLLLLWASALPLLAGELGHKPWGGLWHGLSPEADTPGPGAVRMGAGPMGAGPTWGLGHKPELWGAEECAAVGHWNLCGGQWVWNSGLL